MAEPELSELTITGTGGHQLAVRVWDIEDPRGLVLISHGFGEHAGRYDYVTWRLNEAGFRVVTLDHHGHGHSQGKRGQIDFPTAVQDLDALLSNPGVNRPGLPVYLLGHSMGGGIALRYAIAHRERLTGLILSSPLTVVDANPAVKLIGALVAKVLPGAPTIKLDPKLVSRDPEVVAAYEADPLIFHEAIPAITGANFVAHSKTIMEDAAGVLMPTLLLYGSADGLCPPEGSKELYRAIGAIDKSYEVYDGLYHEILNEPERDDVIDRIIRWLDAH